MFVSAREKERRGINIPIMCPGGDSLSTSVDDTGVHGVLTNLGAGERDCSED